MAQAAQYEYQALETRPGEQRAPLHAQGEAREVLPGLAREGGQSQQAPDGVLGQLLIVLLALHDDVPADLESCRVHLGDQHVLGNPVLQGRDSDRQVDVCPGGQVSQIWAGMSQK